MSQITYVTAFMKIYNTPYNNRDDAYYLSRFKEIANTGIHICVYTDNLDLFKDFNLNNVKIFEMKVKDTWVYQTIQQKGGCEEWAGDGAGTEDVGNKKLSLPQHRSFEKDIPKFMAVMNSKIDFVKDAIDINPFHTSHFAWIDFGISYIFKNLVQCQKLLQLYDSLQLDAQFLCIPGCLGKLSITDLESYLNQVNWRFCGGFFIGDKASIQQFHTLHREFFPRFLEEHRKLVWEVNFWAWLEAVVTDWNPIWFQADHNDSIIEIPTKFYATSLKTACCGIGEEEKEGYKRFTYIYPNIDGFIASSASHYSTTDNKTGRRKHFLNTRYINYTIDVEGWYRYNHPDKKIITRNVASILDPETMVPICYWEVDEDSTGIERKTDRWIEGMEDIRLFQGEDGGEDVIADKITTLDFIATSVNYSNTDTNRMITGKYEIDERAGKCSLKNCRVLPSPLENAGCEKNWIPFGNGSFIYRWSPLEIISLTNEIETSRMWNTTTVTTMETPLCKKFRGSTRFVDSGGDEFLGIVHFTEGEGADKCYFHCFVAIDKRTMKPERYSQPFYFEKKGIEYCIGFYVQYGELVAGGGNDERVEGGVGVSGPSKMKYYFWISQMDREPLMIVTDVPDIKWMEFNSMDG